MALQSSDKFPLWPVALVVALYVYWAYFYKKKETYEDDETVGDYVFAIKDGLWPNGKVLAANGVTISEFAASSKKAAFDEAASDPQAVGVKVDASSGNDVKYKVVRASDVKGGHFRNYLQFYTKVGSATGGMYVKISKEELKAAAKKY